MGREGKGGEMGGKEGRGKVRERKGGGRKGRRREREGRGGERKGRKSSSPNVKLAVDATVHS